MTSKWAWLIWPKKLCSNIYISSTYQTVIIILLWSLWRTVWPGLTCRLEPSFSQSLPLHLHPTAHPNQSNGGFHLALGWHPIDWTLYLSFTNSSAAFLFIYLFFWSPPFLISPQSSNYSFLAKCQQKNQVHWIWLKPKLLPWSREHYNI